MNIINNNHYTENIDKVYTMRLIRVKTQYIMTLSFGLNRILNWILEHF